MVRKHEIPETKKTEKEQPKEQKKDEQMVIRGDARPEKKG